MRDRVEVAVIGGGVVGCSVLYHLTKLGLRDVVLIERDELTSGSTWHAAGGFHTLNGDPNVARLQQYTIDLYKEIEELSDQPCGLHLTGGLMLAGTDERVDFLKREHAKGRYLGMETELISVEEAYHLFPLMDPSRFKGALWNPMEGHLDPSGTTHAYAKAARANGAEIVLRNPVLGIERRPDGEWDVVTKNGTVRAAHVVNAGGLWAREVGRMVGLELPVLAMEHMYILTEDMPEVAEINAKTGKEVVHAIDFEGELYLRQERGGMLMGTYEQGGVPWSPRQTPWDFGHELLQPDLDRIAPSLEVGFRHFPAFERAGIRQIINGPFTFAPGRQPARRPGARPDQFLVRVRRDGGLQPGRRRRPRARVLDRARRPRLRRLRHGRGPLRRLRHDGLHQRQGARELQPPLSHLLPERGTAGRAPLAHDADLRRL